MTTINTSDDLLSLLNENEEFRDAVRRAILTEELLALPAVFADFRSEVRADIKELKDGQNELRGGQRRHTNDIGEQGLSVIQIRQRGAYWIPVFTGMTDSYKISGNTIIERPWAGRRNGLLGGRANH